jgi:hypothetical protein
VLAALGALAFGCGPTDGVDASPDTPDTSDASPDTNDTPDTPDDAADTADADLAAPDLVDTQDGDDASLDARDLDDDAPEQDVPDLTDAHPLDADEGPVLEAGPATWGLGVRALTVELAPPDGVRQPPGAEPCADCVTLDVVLHVAPSVEDLAACPSDRADPNGPAEPTTLAPVALGPPRFFTVPAPPAPKSARPRAWTLSAGSHPAPQLVAWEADRRTLAVAACIVDRDPAHTWTSSPLTIGVGLATIRPLVATRDDGARLAIRLEAQPATPLAGPGVVGLTLDGASSIALHGAELAPVRAGRVLRLKVYQGARRYLVRPGCESQAACAPGGAAYPCVTTCACDASASSCDFAGLEAAMRDRALGVVSRVLGRPALLSELADFRIHYVFKRSFGGSAACDENGEIAASPETWSAFFEAVMHAAHAVNVAAGAPVIDLVSPMNEANHPLQDGAHENAAGQSALGGLRDLGELAASAGCGGTLCCALDRYVARDADLIALTAAALAGADKARAAWVAAGDDPALFPAPALSLFMDDELADPFLRDGRGAAPAIITPPATFIAALGEAVAPGVPVPALALDTYPGSWGAPWYDGDTPDSGFVLHYDAALGSVVRADPVAAADLALTKVQAATDAAHRAFGQRPDAFLGEVGWSVFDLDEAAQATFVRRLFAAAAAYQAREPGFRGILWFKDQDRQTPTYPAWDSATFPGLGSVDCDAGELGAMVCTLGLLDAMDGAWGLFRKDDTLTPRPAWTAILDGLASTPRTETPR